jgi:nitrogen regulatory protein P-II 1
LIKLEVIMAQNDISKVSEGLKSIGVGGISVFKVKGRGRTIPPSIHASKGTEMFTPEFSDKFALQLILPDNKKESAIKIIRENSNIGKIFVSPIIEAVDLASGAVDEDAI